MASFTGYRLVTLRGRVHYAWIVAAASSIISLIAVEPLALFGVFLEPIGKDLGVSRGAVSSVYWLAWLFLGISSIIAGWATDTIGMRKTVIVSSALAVVPLLLLGQATQLWHLYLWYGVVYGLARGGLSTPTLVTITLWFKKRQGLAVGIVSSGLAFGPLVFAPLFRYLIDVFSWQQAFFILGIVSGVVLIPCCWLIRNDPSDVGLQPYGEGGDVKAAGVTLPQRSHEPIYYRRDVPNFFRYALRTQPFFILPAIHLLGCVSHAVPLAHVVVMATDRGIDPIAASTVLGFAVGISATSRLTAPMLADKIGGRKALVLFITAQAISILWLLPAKELWIFYAFSLFFGLGYGGEMTPFPILNRQYYGNAPIGMLYGTQVMMAALGMGMGGFAGGFLYDLTGNYTSAIWVAVGAGFAAVLLSYLLVDPFRPGMRRFGLAGVKTGQAGADGR